MFGVWGPRKTFLNSRFKLGKTKEFLEKKEKRITNIIPIFLELGRPFFPPHRSSSFLHFLNNNLVDNGNLLSLMSELTVPNGHSCFCLGFSESKA